MWNKIYLIKKKFLKILWSEVWKGGFQSIQILGLLGMYYDAVLVEVFFTFLLLCRLACTHVVFKEYRSNFISSNFVMTKFEVWICIGPEKTYDQWNFVFLNLKQLKKISKQIFDIQHSNFMVNKLADEIPRTNNSHASL